MSGISTHVLDTSRGRPAEGLAVELERKSNSGEWEKVGNGKTDADGRCGRLLYEDEPLLAGTYRVTFSTGEYFKSQGSSGLYPIVQIIFYVTASDTRLHIPLLLSPFGYTTYRGS